MSKRLLVFTESYARGGGNRYMIDLANSVAEDFDQVSFVSNPGGIYAEDMVRFNKQANISELPVITRSRLAKRLGRLPVAVRNLLAIGLMLCEPLMLLRNMWLFWRLLVTSRPARVLACNGGYPASSACLAAVFAARLRGTPAVLSIVSMPSRRRPYFWIYDALLDKLVWCASCTMVVNAQAIVAALKAMRGLPEDGAVVVHNGIDDIDDIDETGAPRDNDTIVIGCVARLDAMKGVFVLLDAFTELAGAYPNIKLVLAGDGDSSEEVATRVRQRKLEDRVVLLGHYTGNVEELLRSFDIFAFASLWEGFPYSIVEAMRSERAIVASRVGGIPEAITDGLEGVLVEAGDKAALAAALCRMIDDPALRRACAAAARHRFVSEFSLPQMHRRARAILLESA